MEPLERLYMLREKWEEVEGERDLNKNEYKLVGEFLTDLNAVIKLLLEKKKTCCGVKS